jgi:hypothetical protein
MDPRIKFNSDTLEKLKKNMDEDSVKCMDDEINLLDRSLIQKHKHNTLKFIHQYYTVQPNWTIYHSRLRKSLLKYINDDRIKYKECSAPLKAFLSWDLKNRSNDKAFYIARKYNPEALDELEKINVSAVKKVTKLTSELKIKNDVKVMVDAETNTEKVKRTYGLEKYCCSEISVQTEPEPIYETITDYNPPYDEPDDISDCYFIYTDIIINKKLKEENEKLLKEIEMKDKKYEKLKMKYLEYTDDEDESEPEFSDSGEDEPEYSDSGED